MKLIVCFLIATNFVTIGTAECQDIKWGEAKNWHLYNLHSSKAFKLPIDSLNQFSSLKLNSDTMQLFGREIQQWPKSESAVWMGLFVVTYETIDGTKRKVVISNYGGFLYDPLSRQYYGLSEDMRDQWYEWLNDKSRKLIEGEKK